MPEGVSVASLGVSAPTACPRCRREGATLLMDQVNALSVTYRCLHCSYVYPVLTGELPEIVRTVIRLLLQAREQAVGPEMTWRGH